MQKSALLRLGQLGLYTFRLPRWRRDAAIDEHNMSDPTSLEALQALHGDLLSVTQHLLKPPDALLVLEEAAAAAPGLGSLLDQRRRDQKSRDMVSAGRQLSRTFLREVMLTYVAGDRQGHGIRRGIPAQQGVPRHGTAACGRA